MNGNILTNDEISNTNGEVVCEDNSNNNVTSSVEERVPDADHIKMFVGQVPKEWNETECKCVFEEFGEIYQINVLRDKASQQSRGCCFVTYYTRSAALAAQNLLHNIKKLPGMQYPVQMRPADGDNRNDRKIFIGMIPKQLEASDIKEHFKKFGTIEDASILKDNNGNSRGCCFVTYGTRAFAAEAIKVMNGAKLQESGTAIVVKFADAQKDKQKAVKRGASEVDSVSMGAPVFKMSNQELLNKMNMNNMMPQMMLANQFNNMAAQQSLYNNPLMVAAAASVQPNLFSAAYNVLGLVDQGNGNISPPSTASPNLNSMLNSGQFNGFPMGLNNQINPMLLNSANQLLMSGGLGQFGGFPNMNNFAKNFLNQGQPKEVAGSTNKGDDGCNLFIYHLPQEFTDENLVAIFSKFGNLVSAKVFVDKTTNLSKCFGFASYDTAVSAQKAIAGMNGFQIGNKKLKVQLKNQRMMQNQGKGARTGNSQNGIPDHISVGFQ
uniref:CUGBP Elav-like family member 2 n=1 Tax=Rhabditophanes sp. KR3021 TaxID=114890 RepID=A0AC35TI23_9BILA